MIKLGQYILAGRLQAIAMLSLFTLLSLLLPPLTYLLAGVIVALVTLRYGAIAAVQTMVGALLALQIFVLLTPLPEILPVAYALLIWLPVCIVSYVLQISYSQTLLILSSVALVATAAIGMHTVITDVPAWWQGLIEQALIEQLPPDMMEQYRIALAQAASFINGFVLAALLTSLITTVMFARWWQSLMFNPGEFKKEFFAVVIPPVLAIVMIVLFLATGVVTGIPGLVAGDIGMVLMFAFLFQGIAKIHRKVDEGTMSAGMLFGIYLLLLLIPYVVIFLSMLGMIDSIKMTRQKQI